MPADITIEAFGERRPSDDFYGQLLGAQDSLSERLLNPPIEAFSAELDEGMVGLPNVVGTGLGVKARKSAETEDLCVKVYVEEKLPIEAVAPTSLVPEAIDGVPTDVEEVGEILALSFKNRVRPVPGGVSTGNCAANMAGTLGCFVTHDEQPHALSNNHVFALTNESPQDADIPQPGRIDGGSCPRDVIGQLGPFVPIQLNGGTNFVDAALARIDEEQVSIDPRMIRPSGGREQLVSPHVPATLGMAVQKSGRTTGHTHGIVDAVRVSIRVGFGRGVGTFANQFRVRGTMTQFSAAGDSGSLVTTDPGNQPVGLLFAGGNGFTFCNDVDRVLTDLSATIIY